MSWIRRLALPNIGDRVVISAATLGGAPVFVVTNNNAFDIFKFERGAGRGGADVIATHGGKDHVEGGNSGDHIEASEFFRLTSDTVDGGAGNDFIRTGAAPAGDAVNGGTGADDIATNAGDDRIFVKDGIKDTVQCGLGRDEVTADSQDDIDAISNPGGGTCDDV